MGLWDVAESEERGMKQALSRKSDVISDLSSTVSVLILSLLARVRTEGGLVLPPQQCLVDVFC